MAFADFLVMSRIRVANDVGWINYQYAYSVDERDVLNCV